MEYEEASKNEEDSLFILENQNQPYQDWKLRS
jgi:hypothetical protein